jgi:hypothetical protein
MIAMLPPGSSAMNGDFPRCVVLASMRPMRLRIRLLPDG